MPEQATHEQAMASAAVNDLDMTIVFDGSWRQPSLHEVVAALMALISENLW